MRFLKTNTATRITVGPFFDKTDGVTPETAITVTSCKLTLTVDDGGVPTLVLDTNPTASGGANDMVHITGDDAGFYDLELAAGNVNYVGRAMLAITDAATHCPVFHEFMILPANVYDSLVGGTDVLDVSVTQWLGTAAATPTVAGVPEVDVTHFNGTAGTFASGIPAVNATQISGDATAADNAEAFFDGTGYAGTNNVIPTVTTLTNLPAITTNWLTAAGLATDAVNEIADGILGRDASASTTNSTLGAIINDWENGGRLDLIIDAILDDTDLIDDGTSGLAKIATDVSAVLVDTGTTLDGKVNSLVNACTIYEGTAGSGSTTTLVDATLTQADADYWVGNWVKFTSGNLIGQVRLITDFVPGTDTITFAPATTQAVSTHSYVIIPAARVESVLAPNVAHGGGTATITLEDLTVTGEFAMDTMVVASGLSANITGNITGTLSTVTTLTNLPAITANWLTAAGTASDFGTEVATAVWALATRTLTAATNISGPIADQVWEEAIADHSGTAGSTAEALNAAGAAGDPWTTALPGAYGAGSAGYIIGNNINATISSRASQTSVDDIPTNAELATALGTADDAVLAAIAALNNLSSAQVTAAVWHADVNANDNTVGSFGDYFGQMYTETTVSTPTTLGTLATQASVNTIDDFLDTEIAAIKAKTDNLPAAPAAVGDIPTAIQNADALLNRSITNTQDTADTHSLTAVILATLESSISGTTWTIRKTGGTTFTTKTITVDAGADPITGVT